ncbi:hypothetical protein NDU88_006214 [Pleurodeles waltl]|uniref:Uncharacterized protein n=1 Tax=Pleurodeles waltl TaxID=8319 RepID=A0AAV7SP74_PLEWA|nr:hypothetical protein NDU88_006214 [Pleurodeles waltl]
MLRLDEAAAKSGAWRCVSGWPTDKLKRRTGRRALQQRVRPGPGKPKTGPRAPRAPCFTPSSPMRRRSLAPRFRLQELRGFACLP